MAAPRCDGCSARPLNWWRSLDDLDGFHLCNHHDKASADTLTSKGYQRVEAVVNVEPQTLVG